jgi:hypothetical protein
MVCAPQKKRSPIYFGSIDIIRIQEFCKEVHERRNILQLGYISIRFGFTVHLI